MEEDDCQMGSGESRFSLYIRENPGADFIAAFIVALIIVAFVYSFDKDIANELTNFAFFSLVAGVILQALALRRDKEDSSRKRVVHEPDGSEAHHFRIEGETANSKLMGFVLSRPVFD